jgi:hypothetical protein
MAKSSANIKRTGFTINKMFEIPSFHVLVIIFGVVVTHHNNTFISVYRAINYQRTYG